MNLWGDDRRGTCGGTRRLANARAMPSAPAARCASAASSGVACDCGVSDELRLSLGTLPLRSNAVRAGAPASRGAAPPVCRARVDGALHQRCHRSRWRGASVRRCAARHDDRRISGIAIHRLR
ncbi:hypothetical protein C0Z19_09215 [Trinickia soli]|uniref:Uncharacterized protein n=1 Tax=Trinickia soli TaxID=380675 RepID=A0A2N7W8L4_9BURK|nr:hypothetical protein C0Z19_09215 [Trinickia soli]